LKNLIEMLCMNDRVFIDTNILIYAYLSNPQKEEDYTKHLKAIELLKSFTNKEHIFISIQVCNEYYSALLKHKIDDVRIQQSVQSLMNAVNVASVSTDTLKGAFELKNRYSFSYWDSLILSSSLENHCTLLYSEDMQNGQLIEGVLRIVNPFVGECRVL